VAIDHGLERPLERIRIQRALQAEHPRQVVGRQPRLQALQEPELLLRMGQRHLVAVRHAAADFVVFLRPLVCCRNPLRRTGAVHHCSILHIKPILCP
jgi:hypothetical protein